MYQDHKTIKLLHLFKMQKKSLYYMNFGNESAFLKMLSLFKPQTYGDLSTSRGVGLITGEERRQTGATEEQQQIESTERLILDISDKAKAKQKKPKMTLQQKSKESGEKKVEKKQRDHLKIFLQLKGFSKIE